MTRGWAWSLTFRLLLDRLNDAVQAVRVTTDGYAWVAKCVEAYLQIYGRQLYRDELIHP